MLFFFNFTHLNVIAVLTDTTRIQKPVDFALAGDQHYDTGKSAFAAHPIAKRIFRE